MAAYQERPWGGYEILYSDSKYQVKRIVVNPGLRFSLQKHLRRSEKWIVVSGLGVATIGNQEIPVKDGSILEIAQHQIHRLHNTGTKPLTLIEVQFGDYFGEDDIVRLEDDFGRI